MRLRNLKSLLTVFLLVMVFAPIAAHTAHADDDEFSYSVTEVVTWDSQGLMISDYQETVWSGGTTIVDKDEHGPGDPGDEGGGGAIHHVDYVDGVPVSEWFFMWGPGTG
jgi:hypothetical protein